MAVRPLTDTERAEILRRHAAGETRNQIAAATGRSTGTVSNVVADAGMTFARGPEVQAATEARQADLAALRSQLALDLTRDAIRLRQQMWEPAIVYAFGGKDNTYEEHHVDEPPPPDKRSLMGTAGMAIDRSLKLAPPKDDTGAEAARSMVGQLMAGLADVYREQQEADASSEGDGDDP
jgi:hypothetical protein